MNQLQEITEGFYNSITNKRQDLYQSRIKICRECKLLKIDSIFGEICNKKLWINPKTDEISDTKKSGFIHGCGCNLNSATRVAEHKCPIKKW